ncbi:MAG: magnesium chelatase subunit D family protein [Nocardiaceae bacterium]|nr:magnesium chelatase subunit D family protein [Nocardiaceae bacterium]
MTDQREQRVSGYPFSAIVGHEQLMLALVLCAVHPGIGGVLVRGEKGTAKSTAVRALAALLPAGRLVELPVGATEDRIVGSLDLQKVLRDGETAFQPGLLAAAHHGVLYVDEVNLLHDHLVDVLLDAAAMGRVHIERDGVSHSHAAEFVLVGTMNPEEGELRPQLLDRFGLTVDVAASRDVTIRTEVVRRRLAYEKNPAAFAEVYADSDAELAEHIISSRKKLQDVELPDVELRRIAAVCAAFDVDGMRADLVVARTAMAHAAWRGADEVTADDVRVAAELALPHRRRRDPFDEPGIEPEQLDQAMRDAEEAIGEPEPDPDPSPDPSGGGGAPNPSGDGPTSQAGQPGKSFRTKLLQVPGVGEGAAGRRSRARTASGRAVRVADDLGRGLHLVGTVFAAAPKQRERGRTTGGLRLAGDDLRGAHREGREGNLVIFAVDASGSMAAKDRLAAVTGAVVSLLRDAYQRRDKVAVVSFRADDAQIVLPPTSSVDIAVRRLSGLRTGGRTPLAQGLLRAREVVLRERARDPHRRSLVVVLTDGRATGGADATTRARIAAQLLAAEDAAVVVIDCESGIVRLGLAAELAKSCGAQYLQLGELSASAVAAAARTVA